VVAEVGSVVEAPVQPGVVTEPPAAAVAVVEVAAVVMKSGVVMIGMMVVRGVVMPGVGMTAMSVPAVGVAPMASMATVPAVPTSLGLGIRRQGQNNDCRAE
jgi:hypothetical protein